jgi:hypothetical protein
VGENPALFILQTFFTGSQIFLWYRQQNQLFPCALNLYLIEYNQKILSIILVLEKIAVLL